MKKLIGYAIWFLIILLSLSLFRNLGKIGRVKDEIRAEKDKIAKMQKENNELQRQVMESQKPEFLERGIRDKLGFVKDGETIVVLPDEETLRSLAPQIQTEEETLPNSNYRRWLKLFI